MKCILMIICFSFFIGASIPPVFGKDAPTSESQLLQEFRAALKAKDKEAMLSLFDWQGVPADMKSFHSQMIEELLKQQATNVVLSPLPTNLPTTMVDGGVRYALNISPVGVLDVRSVHKGNPVQLPYGKKGGGFYIAGSTEEIITPSETIASQVITVRVETANGKTLPDTAIVCASPDKVPYLQFGKLFGGVKQLRCDDAGQLKVPLDATDLFLVAADAERFGWIQNSGLTNGAVLVMRPWARIEGVRINRNHPASGEHLMLSPDRDFYGNGGLGSVAGPINNIGNNEAWTDASGRFTFEHVPPLRLFIDRQEKQRGYWGYFWSVDATRGGTNRLVITTRGRTVTGHVIVGPGLDTNIDLAECSGVLMSDMKGREGSRRSVGFPVSRDGTFRADRVEPGDYTMSGEIWRNNKREALLDPIRVHVPDDTSDAEDVPFDMGTVTLKAAVNFMRGDTAPDFSCSCLEGKPFKLSDFRGKYVLLDFWATWCVPCVAETPNLKATYEAFGKDKRFVMISLSLDSKPAAPRKFVRNHGIEWTQGFLGDWSNDKTTQIYGVYGIPAIFLIGPDGKVLATDLRGSKIREAVAAALAH